MAALTRGPLPPSVYWRRRLVVLTVALVVVWALARLLGGGGGDAPRAADVSATLHTPSPTPSTAAAGTPSTSPTAGTSTGSSPTPSTSPSPTALPSPTGACAPSDVSVTPSVTNAVAGQDVTILLTLQTFNTPACTWRVGHDTMQVKITTAGGSDVWSTIQCRSALPSSDVVLYKDTPTPITMTWSAHESDEGCSDHTPWAKIGTYQITGVALGGQPDEASFTLNAPSAPPKPSPTPTASLSPSGTAKPNASVKPSTSSKPSTSPARTAKAKTKHPVAD